MKEFDLDRALAGDPVITKEGKEVTQICSVFNSKVRHVYGVVDDSIHSWDDRGRLLYASDRTDFELKMATVKKTFWCNIYLDTQGFPISVSKPYPTEEEAVTRSTKNLFSIKYYCTIPIEIEL